MKRKGIDTSIVIMIVVALIVVMAVISVAYSITDKGKATGEETIDDVDESLNNYAVCIEECRNYKGSQTYVKKYTDVCKEYYEEHDKECNER